MMPPHLFVMSFLRLGQMLITGFLYIKSYRYKVSSTIDVFCRTSTTTQVTYDVEFPFAWVSVNALSDCSSQPTSTTTYIWTGFGPTAYLYLTLVFATFIYGVTAITFYYNHHLVYDSKKTFPAADLLLSLIMGSLWVLDCYLAWINYPGLKTESSPDKVISSLGICNDNGGYCSASAIGDFGEVNSFLFLSLACALSWGICVWFIFMESGLCPEDDDDLSYSDIEYEREIRGLPQNIVPFFDDDLPAKGSAFKTAYGMDNTTNSQLDPQDERLLEAQQQQFLEYLNSWQKQGAFDQDYDRFSRGLTFTPPVSTISNKELERDVVGTKVHNKWNLFKA